MFFRSAILALTLCRCLYATTTIAASTLAPPTPQQITVVVTTNQGGNCTFRVSEGATFASNVPDLRTTGVDVGQPLYGVGNNTDARAGSVIVGNTHTFVAGFRGTAIATNNKPYSRSLQPATQHWIGATCGSDPEATIVLSTSNAKMGNTWAEPYQYSTNDPTGYAWPAVDFFDKSKRYIDPRTGMLIKRITGPEDQAPDPDTPASPNLACSFAYAPNGNWTNPANGCGSGSNAVSTGTDPLVVVLGAQPSNGDANKTASFDVDDNSPIDDLKVRIHGSSTNGTANNTGLCLSLDGTTCFTDTVSVTTPNSTGDVDFPSGTPVPYFSEWLTTGKFRPPNNPDMSRRTGTIICSGTTITYETGFSFNAATRTAGARIVISGGGGCTGGTYIVSSATDLTDIFHMVLTTSAGTSATASTWTMYGLSLLIFPQAADILNIDTVTTYNTNHFQFGPPASGDQNLCNSNKVARADLTQGWVCSFTNLPGATSLYFVPAATASTEPVGTAVMTASQWMPTITDVPPGDGINISNLASLTGGDITDADNPNVVYVVGMNASRAEYAIAKGTYNFASGDYQKYTPASSAEQTTNMTFVNMTKHSVGGTLSERQAAFDSRFQLGWMTRNDFVATRSGGYIILINWLQQDAYCWVTVMNSSGNIAAMLPSYATPKIRWSPCHSIANSGAGTIIQFSTQGATQGGNGGGFDGVYQAVVASVNGNPTGTLSTTASAPTCPGADPTMAAFLLLGHGCDTVTVTGAEPCKITGFTAYETASFPACSWNAAYRGLKLASTASGSGQTYALGDVITDPATSADNVASGEFMMIVGLSGTTTKTMVLLRNYSPAISPFHNQVIGAIHAHAANFTIFMAAGQAGSAVNTFWDFSNDPTGMNLVNDYTYYPTGHGDQSGNPGTYQGISVQDNDRFAGYYHAYSVRTGAMNTQPGLIQNVGLNPNPSAQTGGLFCGAAGSPGLSFGQYSLDDHPSARATSAPAGEQSWWISGDKLGYFNYMNAGATPVGGQRTGVLNPLTVANVTGSLFKVSNYPLAGSINIKCRSFLGWAGRHNMQEISSAATGNQIGGSSSDYWKMCYAYKVNECRASSSIGDLFMNVPSANTEGTCASQTYTIWNALYPSEFNQTALYANNPCVAPLGPDAQAFSQLNWGFGAYSNGEYARTLVNPWSTIMGVSDFFNGIALPDGSGVMFPCTWCNNVRSDYYYLKLPPTPAVSAVDRSTYVGIAITMSAGADVRLQYGYREFGTDSQSYCMPRKDACATDATGASPFDFVSETAHYTPCSSGCTVTIQVAPGHLAYYREDRMGSGLGPVIGVVADGEGSVAPPETGGLRIQGHPMFTGKPVFQ